MQVKQLFKVHCVDYTPVELDLLGRYIEGVNYFDTVFNSIIGVQCHVDYISMHASYPARPSHLISIQSV